MKTQMPKRQSSLSNLLAHFTDAAQPEKSGAKGQPLSVSGEYLAVD